MGIDEIALDTKSDIEGVDTETRHHVLQVVAYLMANFEPILRRAITEKAVRYNHLKKDFLDMPSNYREALEKFSNWRLIQDLNEVHWNYNDY